MNLSASDLLDPNLVEVITGALAERGLPGSALRLEITESLLVEASSAPTPCWSGCAASASSWPWTTTAPASPRWVPARPAGVDAQDRPQLHGRLMQDARTSVIVASTIEMTHRLGLTVVAEGVETDDQIDWLREHGCDLLQGYRIGRPAAAEQLRWFPVDPRDWPRGTGVAPAGRACSRRRAVIISIPL